MSSGSVPGCGRRCSAQRCCRLWSWLSASVVRRYTCSFASPVCVPIHSSAISAKEVSGRVVLMKHSRVSFYCIVYLFMPRKLNTQHLLFLDLGVRFLDQILPFLYYCVWKPSIGHFGHIQGQAHVKLFQLYTPSLPCHRSRQVEYLHKISCCFKQSDAAITSTIYATVVSSKVITLWFVHSWGCLSRNSSTNIPELRISWCSILRTEWSNALVDLGGFQLLAGINWSHRARCTPAVYCRVTWQPFTTVWIYSHPPACCFIFVLLPVLRTIFKCPWWVIFLVAGLAVLRWSHWCLHSCCVLICDVFDKAPSNQLDLDLLWPGWGCCVSMIWWCGMEEEDDNEKKWEIVKII